MPNWLKDVLDYLDRRLPGLIMFFGLGYKMGSAHEKELFNELMDLKLALKHKEAEYEIIKKYSGKLSSDVIANVIARAKSKLPK